MQLACFARRLFNRQGSVHCTPRSQCPPAACPPPGCHLTATWRLPPGPPAEQERYEQRHLSSKVRKVDQYASAKALAQRYAEVMAACVAYALWPVPALCWLPARHHLLLCLSCQTDTDIGGYEGWHAWR